jgi:hypothetical protein
MQRSRWTLIASSSVVVLSSVSGIVNGCVPITCAETATCPSVAGDGFVPDTSMNDVGAPSTDSAPATDGIAFDASPSAMESASAVDGAPTEGAPSDSAPPADGSPPMDSQPPSVDGGGRCLANTTLPYVVDGNGGTQPTFIASGYEGDTCAITMSGIAGACAGHTIVGAVGKCWSVTVKRPAPCTDAGALFGWAGVVWQFPANNWTDPSTMGGLNICGATKITFWAAAVTGTQTVDFLAGNRAYRTKLTGQVLSTTWRQFTMTLSVPVPDANTSIGFGWSTNLPAVGGSVAFMVDNIEWQ